MKKILLLLMVGFMVVFSGTSGAFAQSPADSEKADIIANMPEDISELDNKDIKKTVGKLNKYEEFREAKKWFKENALEISDLVAGLHMEN